MPIRRERKLIRLSGYDYASPGAYFVTICVHERQCILGRHIDNEIVKNSFGDIVENRWRWLFSQYPYLKMDQFVVMPNHFHGIIHIVDNNVGNGRDRSLHYLGRDRSLHLNQCPQWKKIKPLPELMGAFKTTSSKLIHQSGNLEFKWQKSYHDRIIRDDRALFRIRQYIRNNPRNWPHDAEMMD